MLFEADFQELIIRLLPQLSPWLQLCLQEPACLLAILSLVSAFHERVREGDVKFKRLPHDSRKRQKTGGDSRISLSSVDLNDPYHVQPSLAWPVKVLREWLYLLHGRLCSKLPFKSSHMFYVDDLSSG